MVSYLQACPLLTAVKNCLKVFVLADNVSIVKLQGIMFWSTRIHSNETTSFNRNIIIAKAVLLESVRRTLTWKSSIMNVHMQVSQEDKSNSLLTSDCWSTAKRILPTLYYTWNPVPFEARNSRSPTVFLRNFCQTEDCSFLRRKLWE